MNVLEATGLVKRYGRVVALGPLDLAVPRGSVFGILGPNGSGKSTTIGIVLGATRADEGHYVWFDGREPRRAPARLGALLEAPALYPALTGLQNLTIVARIRRCGEGSIERALLDAGLFARRHALVHTYSLGMRQRLAIAAAFLGDPDVIVLDEPANGLDPEGIAEVRDAIRQRAARGITVILASHLLAEVQKVCTHVAVLKEGQLLASGDLDRVVRGGRTLEAAFLDIVSDHAPPA
ncbi:MAG TPA: ATP-binding cassette domain-containing protein [Vicinamibacterales bacterium]